MEAIGLIICVGFLLIVWFLITIELTILAFVFYSVYYAVVNVANWVQREPLMVWEFDVWKVWSQIWNIRTTGHDSGSGISESGARYSPTKVPGHDVHHDYGGGDYVRIDGADYKIDSQSALTGETFVSHDKGAMSGLGVDHKVIDSHGNVRNHDPYAGM